MKSLILYSSLHRLGDESQLINTPSGHVFIRVEEVELSVGDALDIANPRDGETVLNTIPVP